MAMAPLPLITPPAAELDDDQLARYARHVILSDVGEEGQLRLLASRVAVVGAGGLGSPVLLYLAAAGIGHLGIIDHDQVDISNLQRQIIHSDDMVGKAKVASAAARLESLNPEVELTLHRTRIGPDNALELLADYDLVIDGSDNFAARYLIHDSCYQLNKPLISASLLRFEGQISLFHRDPALAGQSSPLPAQHQPATPDKTACYRCLFPQAPAANLVPRCDTVGIFGAIAGIMGSLQAAEAIKYILGIGRPLRGRLLLVDALDMEFRSIRTKPDPHCSLCGPHQA